MNQVTIFDFVKDPLSEELAAMPLNNGRAFVFNDIDFKVYKKQIGIRQLFEFEYQDGHGLAKSITELIEKIEEIEASFGVYRHD